MPLGSVELASANVERVSTGIVETVRARTRDAKVMRRPDPDSTRREDTGLRKTAQTAEERFLLRYVVCL